MKRILPVLLTFAALFQLHPVFAQTIRKGDKFTDGSRTWTVQEIRMGTIVYMTTAQYDELTLTKVEAEEGVYTLTPSRQADDSPFAGADFGDTVMFMQQDGHMILAVVDAKYNVIAALRPVVEPRSIGGLWYNGSLCYSAKTGDDGNVSFSAMAEGEEMGFRLIPTPEAADTYRIADPLIEAMNEYADHVEKVVYREAGEWDVLCFYGADGSLFDAMYWVSDEADSQELNINQWVPQICGEYTVAGGHTVKLEWDWATIDGQRVPMKVETFNGEVMGVVSLEGQGPLKGSFKLEPTKEGLKVSEMVFDEDTFWYKPTGVEYRLVWKDNGTPRFGFTSDILLNGGLLRYDKSMLRLMRNAILARHGYVFQSKDLKEYFSAQSWYRPAANNADIQLSFIEQLNVDLIKAAEKL